MREPTALLKMLSLYLDVSGTYIGVYTNKKVHQITHEDLCVMSYANKRHYKVLHTSKFRTMEPMPKAKIDNRKCLAS